VTDSLLFALPELPDRDQRATHWWHVADGEIVSAGTSEEWLALAEGERTVVALAPAGSVRLAFSTEAPAAATPRQAAAIARVAAVEASLGDDQALHAVSVVNGVGAVTAVVDNGKMMAWLDWAREVGAEPDHVVPIASLLPLGDEWTSASFGTEHLVGRHGLVMPNDPDLAGHLVGDAEVRALEPLEIDEALIQAAASPVLDLRTGRFARRRRIVIERNRIRELSLLAGVVALITLAWTIVSILKLESATSKLDEQTLAVARAAAGQSVTLETAESALAQRAGGAAYGGLLTPLTGLYDALRGEEQVSANAIAYGSDGTMTTTLAAPTVDPVNRVLIALQRNNYRVTAVPRQSPDGRTMVETTIRSGP
jgi:general secretion pathway protein L